MLPSVLPDDALDALGNPERRRLVALLADGPRSVAELAASFAISRPAVSRHLRVLEDAGLLAHDAVGNRNLYRLDARGFASTTAWLTGFWDDAEARLRLVAENLADETEQA